MRKVLFSESDFGELNSRGYFHEWGTYRDGEVQCTMAIIEDESGRVCTARPYRVKFVETWPLEKQ